MAVVSKRPQSKKEQGLRRIWKAPASDSRLYWLLGSLVGYGILYGWYSYALKTQQFPGPFYDPLRLFGIIAYVLVLLTVSYTLRRRFVRGLPGKVQGWLWMHTWLGVITILIAFLHENYGYITHDYCTSFTCITDTYWAGGALFGLLFLVLSGITGRFLDMWQTRVIAREASSNGVGIVSALETRITELEYTIERLSAGKSTSFKQFCYDALQNNATLPELTEAVRPLGISERVDFQRAYEVAQQRLELHTSLQRQKRARSIIQVWRTVHIVLATMAMLAISYHAVMEMLSNVLHIIPAA